jgi:hypothetical protein
MKPWEYPWPLVLFKYFPPERLHVLRDCSVRFSQRTAFEDDHELQPDFAIFGTSSEIWRYAIMTGSQLSRGGYPAGVVVAGLATDPVQQKRALENLQRAITVKDELGCFCLTEFPNSQRMWTEYAAQGTGFVMGFNTRHSGFVQQLMPRGRLGKVEYSDEPFGSALGTILEEDATGLMFRKRLKYSFESEWRIVRLLRRLQHSGDGIFLSPFDPASVCRIIIRPTCTVETELMEIISSDDRYRNLKIEVLNPATSDSVSV